MSACVETARHLIDAQFPERLNWFPHIASAHRPTARARGLQVEATTAQAVPGQGLLLNTERGIIRPVVEDHIRAIFPA